MVNSEQILSEYISYYLFISLDWNYNAGIGQYTVKVKVYLQGGEIEGSKMAVEHDKIHQVQAEEG